jgi:hypothetical protein
MDNVKFVFVTGVPGSAWSMISRRLKKRQEGFDFTDDTPERQFDLPPGIARDHYTVTVDRDKWRANGHIGAYFGPHHEFGEKFDDLNYYSNTEDFYQECLIPFHNSAMPNKLIRSHWFSYNLEWLWQNCKGHDLMLIYRDPKTAKDWWYQRGGWDIQHPVYTWYQNDQRMWQQIQQESELIWAFGQSKNVEWLDWDHEDSWIEKKLGKKQQSILFANPNFDDTIKIGYLKIN